jgi:hypothetical protein
MIQWGGKIVRKSGLVVREGSPVKRLNLFGSLTTHAEIQVQKAEKPVEPKAIATKCSLHGSFCSRSDYAAKAVESSGRINVTGDILDKMKRPRQFAGAQSVPMNSAAIQGSLVSANS